MLVVCACLLCSCGRGPLFGPDPLNREIVRTFVIESGWYEERFPPPLVCIRSERPLCACEAGEIENVLVGLPAEERLDLNRASLRDLQRLPGIGPAYAERIARYRDRHPFRSVEELRRIRGIGPARYRRLHPLLRVE